MISKIFFCIVIALVVFLPIVLTARWNKRRLSLRREDEDCFFLRYPPIWPILFTPVTILTYICSVIVVFTLGMEDSGIWLLEGIILTLTFMGMFVIVGGLLSEVKVEPDAMTRYEFPLPARKYKFSEITSVRYIENLRRGGGIYVGGKMWLIFYHNGKKLFRIESDMINFERLMERVEAEKWLERGFLKESGLELNEWKDEFTITETAADKLRAVFGLILWSGMFAVCIWGREEIKGEPYYLFCYAFFFLMFLFGIEEFFRTMVRKVTVTYREIQVRNSIGRVHSYSLRDITKVEEKDAFIILYINEKKIAKIEKADKNFALLMERLKRIMEQEA